MPATLPNLGKSRAKAKTRREANTAVRSPSAEPTPIGNPEDENWVHWVHWVQNWAKQCSLIQASLTSLGIDSEEPREKADSRNSCNGKTCGINRHDLASDFTGKNEKPPTGFEPVTCGLQNRCSAN